MNPIVLKEGNSDVGGTSKSAKREPRWLLNPASDFSYARYNKLQEEYIYSVFRLKWPETVDSLFYNFPGES